MYLYDHKSESPDIFIHLSMIYQKFDPYIIGVVYDYNH